MSDGGARTTGSWFFFDPSEVDRGSAVRFLRETLRETAGPMDAMIDRVAAQDGSAFFERAIAEHLPESLHDPEVLSAGTVSTEDLNSHKGRVKKRIDAAELDEGSIAALCAYCAVVAVARAVNDARISSVTDDRWMPVFSELADLLAETKWAGVFRRAAEG